jgi:hypothetical protein
MARAEGLKVVHEALDVLDIAAGIGVGDHRQRRAALQRHRGGGAALVMDLLDGHGVFADSDLRHGPVSSQAFLERS